MSSVKEKPTTESRGGGGNWTGFQAEGASEPASREARPVVSFTQVTPGYFTAMAVPLLKGRGFTEADDEHSPKVAIINETIARRFFGDGDPVGAGFVDTLRGLSTARASGKRGAADSLRPSPVPMLKMLSWRLTALPVCLSFGGLEYPGFRPFSVGKNRLR